MSMEPSSDGYFDGVQRSCSSAGQIGLPQDAMAELALRRAERGFNHWVRADELRDGIQDVTDTDLRAITLYGGIALCTPAFGKFVGNIARWTLASWHTRRAQQLLPRL